MTERWEQINQRYLATQQSASDLVTGFGSLSRVLRLVMQAAVLAVGACLVIAQEATAGVMLAATILAARALAPVELAIANWRPFVTARQSWRRLIEQFAALPALEPQIELPAPTRNLRVTAATVAPPGATTPALHDVSFALEAGSVLGVIGPSGSGKTSLARALVGVWPLAARYDPDRRRHARPVESRRDRPFDRLSARRRSICSTARSRTTSPLRARAPSLQN